MLQMSKIWSRQLVVIHKTGKMTAQLCKDLFYRSKLELVRFPQ